MIFRKYRPEYVFYMELGDPGKNQKFPMIISYLKDSHLVPCHLLIIESGR